MHDNSVKQQRRWRRKQLAELWGVSDRTVDRMRASGLLGEPRYIGRRVPVWTQQQVDEAERRKPAA